MVVLNCRVGILYIIESSCPKNPLSVTTCLFYFGFSLLETHQSGPESDIRQSCHGDSSVPVRSRISDRPFRWAVTKTHKSGPESYIRQTVQVSCHGDSSVLVRSRISDWLFRWAVTGHPRQTRVCLLRLITYCFRQRMVSAQPPQNGNNKTRIQQDTPHAVRLWWRFTF